MLLFKPVSRRAMTHEADSLPDAPLALTLPASLPPANSREPEELIRFRDNPSDDQELVRLREALTTQGDHANLMLLYWIRGDWDPDLQAGARWLDLAGQIALQDLQDPPAALRILSRRLQRAPSITPLLQMRTLLEQEQDHQSLQTLLKWAFEVDIPDARPEELAALSAQLGHGFLQEQRIYPALLAFRRALAYDGQCQLAAEGLSEQLLRAGAWDPAAELLGSALAHEETRQDPARVASIHVRLAHIEACGKADKAGAASHLKAALDALPGDLDIMRALSELLDQQGASPVDPNTPTLWAKTARIAVERGKTGLARYLLERALQISPDAAALRREYREVLRVAGDYRPLVLELQNSLSALSEHPQARSQVHLECADIYAQHLRQPLLAMEHWEAALALCPTAESTQPAWDALLRSFRDEGDWEQIANLLRRRIDAGRSPDPYHDRLDLARIYREQLDEPTRAVRIDHQILSEHDLFDPAVSASYKEYFRNRNEWSELQEAVLFRIQEAEDRGREAHPLTDPNFAEEFAELADICERRLGDLSGAIDAWQRLSSSYPEDPRPAEQIERLQKRIQVWDSMLANYEQDLESAQSPKARAALLKRYAQIHRDRFRDPTTAIALAEEYLEIEGQDVAMRRMLLSLLERDGDASKIASVLEQQLDGGTNPAERLSILRRLCNLYHRQLRQFDKAIAACESQLEVAPRSTDALHRIEQIHRRTENTTGEIDAIERQLELAGRGEQRCVLLRRLARAKQRDEASPEVLIEIWEQIQSLEPDNALVLERLLQLAVEMGDAHRVERTLASIADRLNAYPAAKVARLVELATWAQHELQDPDGAEDAWSRVLAIVPHHPQALSELSILKSERDEVEGLLEVLELQAQVAPTRKLRDQAQWHRVSLLAERQGAFEDAIDVLDDLRNGLAREPKRVHECRLNYLEQTDNTHEIARECEVGLIAEHDRERRVRLYEQIERAHLHDNDLEQAVAIASRYCEEFPQDREGFARLAEYNLRLDRLDPALQAFTQRRDLLDDLDEIRDLDVHMSQLCEDNELHLRSWEYLSHPLQIDLEDEESWDNLRAYGERHEDFSKYMGALQLRLDDRESKDNQEGARSLYLEASWLQEQRFHDSKASFDWAQRGYMRYASPSEGREELRQRLWTLAQTHQLYEDLFAILDKELSRRREHGETQDIDMSYLEAARVAQEQLQDPRRAIRVLEQGLEHLSLEGPVAQALDEVCRDSRHFAALESLYQRRIAYAQSDNERLDHYLNLIELCERELNDPKRAFSLCIQAWDELREDSSASDECAETALDRSIALAREHELWAELAKLYDRLARISLEAKKVDQGLDQALECASILRNQLQKPVEATRTLLAYLNHDQHGEQLLGPIRDLCGQIDEQGPYAGSLLGTLCQLTATAQVLSTTDRQDLRVELLSERAILREDKIQSAQGPVVEWLRLLELDPENPQARAEINRLCEEDSRKRLALFRPAWELQNAQSATQKSDLLHELADLYEQRLERNEYAFRARLEAYKLQPWLPEPDALGDEQQRLWDLARMVGDYRGPALPEDALLRPRLSIPERSDEQRWEQLGFSLATFLDRSRGLPRSQSRPDDSLIEEIDEEVVEIDDLEELVELDDEQLSALPLGAETIEYSAGMFSNPTLRIPPPVAKALIPGHPVVPTLHGPILGRRPRVDSAWQELSDAYGQLATGAADRDAQVLVLQARMWEQSAEHVEAAFQAHEHALMRNPGDPVSSESLEALAERHDAKGRLIQSIQYLYRRAPNNEVAIELGRRLAELSLERHDTETAINCYREIILRDAQHIESLSALCTIYQDKGDHASYAEIFAQKLEVERYSLSTDERIERALHLADNYARNLARTGDAISTLRSLVDDHPNSVVAQDRLIEVLKENGRWSQAVEAMRNATYHCPDDARRRALLSEAARIYRVELNLPDRAIDIWQSYRELHPEDPQATIELENLYLQTQRYEQLVAVLESCDQSSERPELLRRNLVKGLALNEGLQDAIRAKAVFDELSQLMPLQAEHLSSYTRFVRGLEVPEKAIALLRSSLTQAPTQDKAAFFEAWRELRELAPSSMSDLVDLLDRTRAEQPEDEALLRVRIAFARERDENQELVELLTAAGSCEDLLEAAERCLGDEDRIDQAQLLAQRARQHLGPSHNAQVSARLARVEFQIALAKQEQTLPAIRTLDAALNEIQDHETAADYWVEAADALALDPDHAKVAARAYEKALERAPNHAGARLQLAQLAIAQGETERAESMLTEIVHRPPGPEDHPLFVQATIDLAALKTEQDEDDLARSILLQSFRLLPNKIRLRVALAEQCLRQERWRDLLSSADQLDTQLAREPEEDPSLQPQIARLYELAAKADKALNRPKGALSRLESARQYNPDNPRILLAIVELAKGLDRTEQAVAAREQLACVYGTDARSAGHQLLLGSLELFEAANSPEAGKASNAPKSRASGHTLESESGLDRVEQRQARAVRLLESSLGQLSRVPQNDDLPYADLERALVRCSAIAPSCVPALIELTVLNPNLPPQRRFELHLQSARLLNALSADQTDPQEHYPRALKHALAATELLPSSSRAQLAKLRAYERLNQEEQAKATLLEALALRPAGQEVDPQDAVEKSASVTLLRKIAEQVDDHDPRLLESLMRMHQLAPETLSIQERHRLARAQSAHPDHPFASAERVYENCAALIRLDPSSTEHLESVWNSQREQGHPSASMTEQVLACAKDDLATLQRLEPEIEALTQPLGDVLAPSRSIAAQPFATAFATLWQHAREIVFTHLPQTPRWTPREALDPSASQNSAMASAYANAKLQFPTDEGTVPVFYCENLPPDCGIVFVADIEPWFAVDLALRDCEDSLRLTYLWTRALYHAQPEHALTCGLSPDTHTDLIAAILLAFHPRHTRRRHQARQKEDRASKLGLTLARKVPIRSARAVTKAFKDAPYAFFASDQWLAQLQLEAQSYALLTTGAIRSCVPGGSTQAWNEAFSQEDNPIRELTAFFLSPRFSRARTLGKE